MPAMEKISIDEIARAVGVAKSTVSRALNNSGYVAPSTRALIMEAVNNLGYRRNLIARNLRSQSSNFIGLIIPDIGNEYFSMLAKNLEIGLRKDGYALFLCNSEESPRLENFYIDSLLDNQVAALVITSASKHLSERFLYSEVPIVLMDRYIESSNFESLCCITCDNDNGGQLAAEKLITSGSRNLLIIGDERHIYGSEKRVKAAYKRALELGCPAEIIYVPVSAGGGYAAIKAQIREGHRFDGIFCATDIIAFGVLHALHELKKQVPDEIQVIGFDGIELAAYTNPPLTTCKQDIEGIAEATRQSLMSMIKGEKVERLKLLPVHMIERSTTK
jgi:DNA-binding LacI/PurR family transcriptional regulator